MKIGLFTMPYMRLPLERAFTDAARFGYDGVEVWGADLTLIPSISRGRELATSSIYPAIMISQ
jgi:sugar phosphate isomerase/epimerase